MKPDLEAVAGDHPAVDLVVWDATDHASEVAEMGVMATPTLIVVRNGGEEARIVGRRTRSELDEIFSSAADGDLGGISRFGKGDRIVWAVAGASLVAAGLAMGPQWLLVAIGGAVAGYANIR